MQHGGGYLWNRSHENAEPGLYLGDSPPADYVIAHNSVYRNQYGVFIRHSAHGRVHDNRSWGNWVSMFLLDDGEQGGLHNMPGWCWCRPRSVVAVVLIPATTRSPATPSRQLAAGRLL